ncbi:MAG TPA: YlbF family regulator [Longimicrobium sp.]|jgi:cell fate (sporulation/competence/biofilm development) regulator YlbF (YheA/YmcA/DUF963 family)
MEMIWEKAREVGRLVAQSDEYKAFKRANTQMADDRDLVTRLNRLNELQVSFQRSVEGGVEPPMAEQEEFERLATEVQTSPVYQGYASAQSNFDRLMVRIQEEIAKGVEAGEQSRIILPS